MKFKDYQYKRPDIKQTISLTEELLNDFLTSNSAQKQIEYYEKFVKMSSDIETMVTLAQIRHSINTNDEFYDAEKTFFDENIPILQDIGLRVAKALVSSKYRQELEEHFGKYLFSKIDLQLKTFTPEIIPLLIQENKLTTKYEKLIASAKIDFEGEIRNLSQMTPFIESINRDTRKQAQLAVANFFSENETEIDNIYDELVKLRTKIAIQLGFKNFVELGYARLGRTDYGAKEVANYRKQVYDDLVLVCQNLIKRQQKRLNIPDFKYYDLNLKFIDGNAKPIGNKDYLVNQAQQMYSEMSKETKEFFDYMVEKELLDLEAKKGKQSGGYCTFISNYKSPFIFANFNGTSGDVDVLTHEAGHAFQVYQARNFTIPEYIWPTLEACEIHSMSMEFFAWPWLEAFFGSSTAKYKYTHLSEALLFVPYGVTVDEFQHVVYENPDLSPAERKNKWREIEKKYLPHKIYDDNPFFEKGGWWFRQGHIFANPFYYIDYTLAQMCALQYFLKSQKNYQEAWDNYVKLCKLGGSKPFLSLLEEVGLNNPFIDGTIRNIVKEVGKVLEKMNDVSL